MSALASLTPLAANARLGLLGRRRAHRTAHPTCGNQKPGTAAAPPIEHGTQQQRTRSKQGPPLSSLPFRAHKSTKKPAETTRGPHVRTVEKETAHTFAFLCPSLWPPKKKQPNALRRFGTRGCVPALLGLPRGRRRQRRRRWASPDVNAPTPRPIDAPYFRVVTLARARHFRRRCCFRHSRGRTSSMEAAAAAAAARADDAAHVSSSHERRRGRTTTCRCSG